MDSVRIQSQGTEVNVVLPPQQFEPKFSLGIKVFPIREQIIQAAPISYILILTPAVLLAD